MKHLLIAGAMSCALAACNTTSGGAPSIDLSANSSVVQNAISLAQGFCSIAPTAETIAGLFTADPTLGTATAAAQAFCAMVPKNKIARRTATRKASGVVDYGVVMLPNGSRVDLKGTPK